MVDNNQLTDYFDVNVDDAMVAESAITVCPIGTIINFGGATLPTAGWLHCDGSAISRTTYVQLFQSIGTTYGAGDGSTTFNLPDLEDSQLQSGGTITVKLVIRTYV
jgi:microcystin-dependent protein